MDAQFATHAKNIETNLNAVIKGKPQTVHAVLTSLLAGGHVLLEDVPGTGKTTLAKGLAQSINGTFKRIQFTPDLLPADITGSSYYNPKDGSFTFREGPVFANVVLADEINRTSPRTQSALLEVMSENQITIDGRKRALPQPFFVIATQNPIEFHGTYPLPEAQLDRFAVRLTLGYPEEQHEIEVLSSQRDHHPLEDTRPVIDTVQILAMQSQVRQIRVDKAIIDYIVRLVQVTRSDVRLKLGISPRGSLTLYRQSQAMAALAGRDYVIPEDVRELAVSVLAHRLVLDTKSKYAGVRNEQVIAENLASIPVPR